MKKKFVTLFVLVFVFAANSVFAAPASGPAKKVTAKKKVAAKKVPASSIVVLPPTSVGSATTMSPTAGSSTASDSSASIPPVVTTSTVNVPSSAVSSTSSASSEVGVTKKSATKKIDDRKRDLFQIGGRLRSFNGFDTASQPKLGFETASSDQTGEGYELSLQAKFGQFGVEWLPLPNKRRLDTQFFGASLGGITVTTSNVVIAKFFPVDSRKWSWSVGIGAENTKITDAIMMGGTAFPTIVKDWSPVFQIGGWYHLMNWLSLGMDYERSNVRLTTKIPSVPDLISTYTDRLSVRLMFGFGRI